MWRLLLMIVIYHQTKTSIDFWYKQELNPRFFIQQQKTLLIELIGTHQKNIKTRHVVGREWH